MEISLPESLLFLAIDQKGNNLHSHQACYLYSLAGAVLLELLLAKRVGFQSDKTVVANSDVSSNDDILEEAIQLCTIPNNTIYWTKFKKMA